jgi:Peroxisomal biogenesis factor 11 (PEX11)
MSNKQHTPAGFINTQSDKFQKLISTVDGRDKLYKTIQYGARVAWYITNTKDPKHPSLVKLAALDATMSEARRVFRLGGFIREYKDLVSHKITPTLMGIFKFTSNLGNTIGEVMDLIIWLAKLRVLDVSKDRWEWWRNILWMNNILYILSDQFFLFLQTWQIFVAMVCFLLPRASLVPSPFYISCVLSPAFVFYVSL